MRFVVTFNDTGTEGVMIFTATDMEDAYRFISDPANFYDPSKVSTPIPFSGGIDELYRLFPLKSKTVEES
jgi:hypothetical protein